MTDLSRIDRPDVILTKQIQKIELMRYFFSCYSIAFFIV